MKNYLFFDTETTGLPKDWNAPADQFPRLVQLAYLIYDEKENLIESGNHIIKPVGFVIPKEASDIHGTTHEMALKKGVDVKETMVMFAEELKKATYIIGHNISFDAKIIRGELMRTGVEYDSKGKKKICTMQSSTKFCELPNKKGRGFKWPTNQELHKKLFGKEFEGAHDAMADIKATAKSFWKLKDLGVLKDKL